VYGKTVIAVPVHAGKNNPSEDGQLWPKNLKDK
jgi:hypothetical protein